MATSSLNLQFVNNTGLADSDVYITFQNRNPGFDVTYGSNVPVPFAAAGNLMSTSLSLAQIGSAGLTVTNVIGVVVYVSYGAALKSTTSAPSFIGSGGKPVKARSSPTTMRSTPRRPITILRST